MNKKLHVCLMMFTTPLFVDRSVILVQRGKIYMTNVASPGKYEKDKINTVEIIIQIKEKHKLFLHSLYSQWQLYMQ